MGFTLMAKIKINSGSGSRVGINKPSGNRPAINKVELYLLAGQSNVGRARTSLMTAEQSALYAGPIANTKIFNPYLSDSQVYDMNVGVNTMLYDANTVDEFGCEAALFKNLQSLNPSMTRYLLKFGDGATSMRLNWSSRSPKELWLLMLEYMTTLTQLIVDAGQVPIFKSFIWMQGEGDASSESFAPQYAGRFADFNTDFRAFWQARIAEHRLPPHDYVFVVGRINSPTALYRDAVRTAEADFCTAHPNDSVMIDTDSYPLSDIVHYNETGQIMFGLDIFNAIT